jgi:hypothetical protein
MQTRKPINVPVDSATTQEAPMTGSNCSGNELVALMVKPPIDMPGDFPRAWKGKASAPRISFESPELYSRYCPANAGSC